MSEYFVKKLINGQDEKENQKISLKDGLISDVSAMDGAAPDETYAYAIPGLIDVHTNGRESFDMMSCDAEEWDKLAASFLKVGVTSFVGTLTTSPLEKLDQCLQIGEVFLKENKKKAGRGERAEMIGFHIEGPWISNLNRGAHNPDYIIEPDEKTFEMVRRHADVIKKITFSYHTKGARKFLEVMKECDIVPAAGHDCAIDADAVEGFKNGITSVTHAHCSTASFQRVNGFKHLGTLEMALITEGVTVEIIADGFHITKYFWDFIRHNKSVDDIIVISDSSYCAGLPNDPNVIYDFNGKETLVDNGVVWLKDRSTFAGSAADLHGIFKRLVLEWGVSLTDAVKMTCYNPARQMKIENVTGSIAKGYQADLLLLDEDLNIQKIIKSGCEVCGQRPDS